MDDLLEAINDYYHQNGRYPKVKVSESFYDQNWDKMVIVLGFVEIDETLDQWELE